MSTPSSFDSVGTRLVLAASAAGRAMLACIAGVLLTTGPAQAQQEAETEAAAPSDTAPAVDFMNLPALELVRAERALLLDVTLAGDRIVAVGERGLVIYSDDHGATWDQGQVPVSQTLTGVYFPTPQKGWVIGHEGLVLHSTDAGVTWTKQLDGMQVARQEIVQARANLVEAEAAFDAASEEDENFLDIEDAFYFAKAAVGDLEIVLENGPVNPFLDVWFSDENNGMVIGAYGMFFVTDDGGATWNSLGKGISNPDKFHFYGLSNCPSGKMFLAGEAGLLYRSIDGGANWETLDSPYEGSFFGTLCGSSGGSEYALVFGLRGNVWRSTDGGDTWNRIDSGTESALFGGTVGGDGTITIVGAAGMVLSSTDGGESFSTHIRSDRRPYSTVHANGNDNLVLVGRGGFAVITSTGKDVGEG